ncbi:hypothetical protein SAY87_016211 [Trapa incisa]|uniref:Uncharacterized protein n=1 Tax=Trapa incisa TaxID=236973 RepID=A0AAN7L853_9MYRT|nr:hypothetical protein SAY87_016211 [Trapa incisa]
MMVAEIFSRFNIYHRNTSLIEDGLLPATKNLEIWETIFRSKLVCLCGCYVELAGRLLSSHSTSARGSCCCCTAVKSFFIQHRESERVREKEILAVYEWKGI